MNRITINEAVGRELKRQIDKFGADGTCANPEMPAHLKMSILTEEVGEVAHALIEYERQGTDIPHIQSSIYDLIAELIQVIAVATAWLFSITDPDD